MTAKKGKPDMPLFEVEVTNTWRVTVEAKNEKEAKSIVKGMSFEGYDCADDYNGAEIIYAQEKEW